MEARCKGLFVAVFGIATILATNLFGATERSRNFIVTAATPEIAKQVVKEAELCRYKLALEWLGKPIPNWKAPCTVNVKVGQIGAGGATTFVFDRGTVHDFKMNIQGSLERILDSVLPHEINHTIFAEHFRRPMPRWADEGAATFVEDESERKRQMLLAMDVLKTARRIPLKSLLSIMDYPRDMRDVLNLYAEGYVLTELLIQCGGRAKFLKFLNTAHIDGWDRAIHSHYGQSGISGLDQEWNQWVMAGCPAKVTEDGTLLASNDPDTSYPVGQVVARSQAPDREPVTAVDAAHAEPQMIADADSSRSHLGLDLQAPVPQRRNTDEFAEPAMLKQVNLGSEMEFVPPENRGRKIRDDSRELALESPRQRRPQAVEATLASYETDAEDVIEIEEEPVEQVRQARPPVRSAVKAPSRPTRTVASSPRRNSLATPSLRLDSPTQLGSAREISDADF